MAKSKRLKSDYDVIEPQSRGNYRSTYSSMLDDQDYQKLSSNSRHALHVLKMTRVGNFAGIFFVDDGELATIAKQVGIDQSDILAAFDELEKGDWVYYAPPVMWVRNALRFEPVMTVNNWKHRRSIVRTLVSLPESPLVVAFCKYYGFDYPPGYDETTITDGESMVVKSGDAVPQCPTPPPKKRATKKTTTPKAKKKGQPDADKCAEIIRHLSETSGMKKPFDDTADEHHSYIRGRWQDGHRMDDFMHVIDVKVAEWRGTEQAMYLRPSTLFSRKHFSEYLAQPQRRGLRPQINQGKGKTTVNEVE